MNRWIDWIGLNGWIDFKWMDVYLLLHVIGLDVTDGCLNGMDEMGRMDDGD